MPRLRLHGASRIPLAPPSKPCDRAADIPGLLERRRRPCEQQSDDKRQGRASRERRSYPAELKTLESTAGERREIEENYDVSRRKSSRSYQGPHFHGIRENGIGTKSYRVLRPNFPLQALCRFPLNFDDARSGESIVEGGRKIIDRDNARHGACSLNERTPKIESARLNSRRNSTKERTSRRFGIARGSWNLGTAPLLGAKEDLRGWEFHGNSEGGATLLGMRTVRGEGGGGREKAGEDSACDAKVRCAVSERS
ncbi:hypothetical protein KM043_009569 [Ampulex compressa]|nr:hypothetical protein KM043_009569 [Ampulex compressa]